MIEFNYETEFILANETSYSDWLNRVVTSEGFSLNQLSYIFCDDKYLLDINKRYLQHDTYTDIITFDYSNDMEISGDIFVSTERVEENADIYKVSFDDELKRVMAHGALHLMGYRDKESDEILLMRAKEDEKIKLFHVEQ